LLVGAGLIVELKATDVLARAHPYRSTAKTPRGMKVWRGAAIG